MSQPKAYEAGSSADSKEAASSSLTLAAGAGLVAIGAVVVGLGVLSGKLYGASWGVVSPTWIYFILHYHNCKSSCKIWYNAWTHPEINDFLCNCILAMHEYLHQPFH